MMTIVMMLAMMVMMAMPIMVQMVMMMAMVLLTMVLPLARATRSHMHSQLQPQLHPTPPRCATRPKCHQQPTGGHLRAPRRGARCSLILA